MEDYPSNAYKSKSNKPSENKKIEKVVTGGVKTKKKSEAKKLADVFISEDISNVKSYVIMDVLIPAIKKAIADIVTNGIDMILYGESGRTKRSTSSKISYNRFYNSSSDFPRENAYQRGRNGFDYDEIIFDNRGDAEAVLMAMEEVIDQYGVVSVGDLYDLAEVTTSNYAVNNYGWTDLHNAGVMRVREGGYMLKLPRALPLK